MGLTFLWWEIFPFIGLHLSRSISPLHCKATSARKDKKIVDRFHPSPLILYDTDHERWSRDHVNITSDHRDINWQKRTIVCCLILWS